MKNSIVWESGMTIALIALAVLILNPFRFWMPDMMVVAMLAAALVAFGAYASFVARERAIDERDGMHRMLAGRSAFLAGAAVLMVGILVQGVRHAVDPWLVAGLVAMIVAKLGTRAWSDRHL